MIPQKGVNEYAVAYLVSWIKSLGHKKVVMRSDNERSLLKLLDVVTQNLPGVEVVPKTSPEGDHQANGFAEGAVREGKGQIRATRLALEAKLKEKLSEDEPVLTWIPRFAANSINRYRIGADGKTPERRRTGRTLRRRTVLFGEKAIAAVPMITEDEGNAQSLATLVCLAQEEI